MLRVLVIDESQSRAADICAGLVKAGHQVAAVLASSLDLAGRVEELKPDVILIETDSPSRDTLEHLSAMNREMPRPVIIFANDDDSGTIREAMKAGVSSYVVDGLDPARIKPIVEVARARFEETLALRRELEDATQKLSDRKVIERAKGLLMKTRKMEEEEAYHALRRLAMDRGQSMSRVARDVIEMAKVLL
ncbi:MAG TPA: ANTAR domain-containing protein [Azospira sp.]|nr:ANTAR domain-containing protein [Azospira sp.]